VAAAFGAGSLLDLDHFFAARSLQLKVTRMCDLVFVSCSEGWYDDGRLIVSMLCAGCFGPSQASFGTLLARRRGSRYSIGSDAGERARLCTIGRSKGQPTLLYRMVYPPAP